MYIWKVQNDIKYFSTTRATTKPDCIHSYIRLNNINIFTATDEILEQFFSLLYFN